MTLPYTVLRSESSEGKRLTIVDPMTGKSGTISEKHIGFKRVEELITEGAAMSEIVEIIENSLISVAGVPTDLSPHLSFDGHNLRWDGTVVNNALGNYILRMYLKGDARYSAAAHFMGRLLKNPDPVSRRNAWRWLAAQDFTLTQNGLIVGYKGVHRNNKNLSKFSGKEDVVVRDASGRDEIVRGKVPNEIGSTIMMSRGLIDSSRDTLCSVGLHVGTFSYATGFGERVLLVLVDPAHIVAVPRDADDNKMRVEQYTVHSVVESKVSDSVFEV